MAEFPPTAGGSLWRKLGPCHLEQWDSKDVIQPICGHCGRPIGEVPIEVPVPPVVRKNLINVMPWLAQKHIQQWQW